MEISHEGLCSIAMLTAILWGCLFVEKLTVASARADAYRALDQIRALQLKKRIIPAATPALPRQQSAPVLG